MGLRYPGGFISASYNAAAFNAFSAGSVEYLVVAGGGGGGYDMGGGGGAGGYRTDTAFSAIIGNSYTVTVGAGGAGATGAGGAGNGNDSSFGTITSTAGGRGGTASALIKNGSNGGSGKLADAIILHLTNAILHSMMSADIKAGGAKSAAKCYIMYERI